MRKITTAAVLTLTSALLVASAIAQDPTDTIILKDKSMVQGTIVEEMAGKSLRIRTKDGSERMFSLDQIERILYGTTFEIIPEDFRDMSYPELGVTLGTPAGLNLAVGDWFGLFGVRASGMAYGDLSGIQANLGFKLSDNRHRSHSVAVVAGKSRIEQDRWSYVGCVYELNWSGFFLQVGMTVGRGSFTSPQATGQVGWMYRFTPKVK